MAKELKNIPAPPPEELSALLGSRAYAAWKKLCAHTEANYKGVTAAWSANNRAGAFELKYRKGGKTLCTFYAREKHFGFMLVFGKEEQARFAARRDEFAPLFLSPSNEDAVTRRIAFWEGLRIAAPLISGEGILYALYSVV